MIEEIRLGKRKKGILRTGGKLMERRVDQEGGEVEGGEKA